MNLHFRPGRERAQWAQDSHLGSQEEYAFDAQIWYYPELNMQILYHDRALHGHYSVPALREPLENSQPDEAVLAKRQDLVSLGDGFAVFPTLPPRGQRLDVFETLVAFEGREGPRLAAFVQADGETLEARWSVADAAGRTVAKGAQATGRSLCAEDVRSGTEFVSDLPPGRYEVAVSVHDSRGRRGFTRATLDLARPDGTLALSSLVLCCGEPSTLVDREAVRLEPLPGGAVSGTAPLAAYFEIYHLGAGPDRRSRYTFEYRVERMLAEPGSNRESPSGTVTTWASREETYRGGVRRQFLTLPIAPLPPGRYRVTTTVHDLVTGASDACAADFTRR